MTSSKLKAPVYDLPDVVLPFQSHKTTLIILYGRGSTAKKFAEPLLSHHVSPTPGSDSPTASFRDHFPHTKFIFPTAPLRRAAALNRSTIHQWFDNWSLTEPEVKQHLQIQGLHETNKYLHDLLREEIEIIGAGNVAFMGLSQGCAASLVATMLWEGEPFGAVVGMCGYTPLRKSMEEAIEDGAGIEAVGFGDEEEEDMFERNEADTGSGSRLERAIEWLCEELDMSQKRIDSAAKTPMQSIPVFMGHGADDEKVPVRFGKMAAEFLGSVEVDVTWIDYEGLGHWYSSDMLRDVVAFLRTRVGWEDTSV